VAPISVSFRHSPGGLCPPGERLGPPRKCDKKILGGFAPDFIVGSGGVFRGERSGDCPAVRGGKIFLCVCVGGREERIEEREDEDEGRSCDWLDWLKIGGISKKKGRQKILHRRLMSVGLRGGNFFIRPSGDPIPPRGYNSE
jgi:hypothetical protein